MARVNREIHLSVYLGVVDLSAQDVHWETDVNWPRSPPCGESERPPDHVRDLRGVGDRDGLLCYSAEEGRLVDSCEHVAFLEVEGDIRCENHHGDAAFVCLCDPREHVGGAHAGPLADAWFAADLGVSVGHEYGAPLVPRHHVDDLGVVVPLLVEVQSGLPWEPEYVAHLVAFEHL